MSPIGFLGEGDAVTKAIQDARQLLHGHSGALESSPNTPFRKVWAPTLLHPSGHGWKTESEATKGNIRGKGVGAAEGADEQVALSTQDLISLDTSPAKERLEENCVHPLEEAMLGCDVDGEGSGYWASGQEGPPLLPTRARVGHVVFVSSPFVYGVSLCVCL